MRRAIPLLGLGLVTACGCDAVGYPAVDVTLNDLVTGERVPLAGATVSYANRPRQGETMQRHPATDTSSTFWICCTPGRWQISIVKPGYEPWQGSIPVRSSGRCEKPVLTRVVARLRPRAPAASSTTD